MVTMSRLHIAEKDWGSYNIGEESKMASYNILI